MREFTLNVGDRIYIGGDVIMEHLEKTHPKAISAQMVRLGFIAPEKIRIEAPRRFDK